MAEADAEQRHIAFEQALDHRHRIFARRRRVARPVRQEHAIGLQREHFVERSTRGHDGDLRPRLHEVAEDVVLGAVVDRNDMRLGGLALAIAEAELPVAAGPVFIAFAGHAGDEIEPLEPAPFGGLCLQCRKVEFAARAVRDHRIGRTGDADAAGQRARIDTRQADLAVVLHPFDKFVLRAEIRMRGHFLPHHAAHRSEAAAFMVFLVRADIADMREGEGDDLAVVGRIGHHFLIAGHRGVEADFAHRATGGTEPLAPDDGAVTQHEDSRRA